MTDEILEAMNYVIEVTPGNLLSDFNIELFGPDDDYNKIYSDLQTTAVNHTINLSPGSYKIRIYKKGCNPLLGAYLIRVYDNRDLLTISGSGGAEGNIEFDGDNDWYEFDIAATNVYSIRATNISSTLKGKVNIYLYQKDDREKIPYSGGSHDVTIIQGYGTLPTQDIPDFLIKEGNNTVTEILNPNPGHYWVRVRAVEVIDNVLKPWEFTTGTYTISVN